MERGCFPRLGLDVVMGPPPTSLDLTRCADLAGMCGRAAPGAARQPTCATRPVARAAPSDVRMRPHAVPETTDTPTGCRRFVGWDDEQARRLLAAGMVMRRGE